MTLASICFSNAPGQTQTPILGDIQTQLVRAAALREKGDFPEARKIYDVLLPQLRSKPASAELAETLFGLGQIANAEGHYDSAVDLAQESARVYQRIGDQDGQALARNDAGIAYTNAGKYADAAKELEMALDLNRQNGNAKTAVLILNNSGGLYYYQAKYSEAFRAYQSAMQRLEQAGASPWVSYWRKVTLFNLAVLYQRLGDDERALSVYQELQKSPLGLEQRELGLLYANLGVLYRHLGDPKKALDAYGKAEQFYALEHDTEGELGVKMNTGIVLVMDFARFDSALKTFTRIRDLAEKIKSQREAMQALLYRAETLYRTGDAASAKKQLADALREAETLGTVEEQWKALYALGRIAESEGQTALAETRYGEAIRRIESIRSKIQLSQLKSGFLADKRDVYDALIKLLLQRHELNLAFEYMERSRARVFQDRFAGEPSQAPALSLEFVRGRLQPSTALIEFWIGRDTIAAIWVTRDSTGVAQRALTPEEMEAFTSLASHLPDALGENWKSDFAAIQAFLPDNIAPLSDRQYVHLLIIPDGFLSLIPFELMLTSSGSPWVENHDLSYLPTAALLARDAPKQSPRVRFPWEQQLVAFGDPVIGRESSGVAVVSGAAEGDLLPGSAEEIRQIARMSSGRSRIFLGADDRKQSFLQTTNLRTELLHVSTHAVADLDHPERSRLLFSPEGSGQANDFLFLKELYDLDLRDVNLVVLSACDTERGKLTPGEGIQAFSRVLLADGSRSALTTLWRVPDQPAAEFVKRFYFYLLKQHNSKAEALRQAKLEFLRSGSALSHPRYWAAFVLNGDGTGSVPRFIPWQLALLPLPITVILLVAYWYFHGIRNARSLDP